MLCEADGRGENVEGDPIEPLMFLPVRQIISRGHETFKLFPQRNRAIVAGLRRAGRLTRDPADGKYGLTK